MAESCKGIATMHLSLISDCLELHSKYIYESEVDDQLLTNWLYKTPKSAGFYDFRTKLTFGGVMNFVDKLIIKLSVESCAFDSKVKIYFGQVKIDENYQKQLAIALRNSALTWEIKNSMYNPNVKEIYVIGVSVRIFLHISMVESSRITRRQARDKIDVLRANIEEKLLLNPDYHISADIPIMNELTQLGEVIYPEWTDLADELQRLERMEH